MMLHIEPWSWSLEQTDVGVVLNVVCGTVGLYERMIVLDLEEVRIWERGGPAALEPLVAAIRNDVTGEDFAGRYRPDLL